MKHISTKHGRLLSGPVKVCIQTVLLFVSTAGIAPAQDHARNNLEPIDPTIHRAELTSDYLVDGDLTRDDPENRRFRTIQAAYDAAPPGTETRPTIIGIRPNAYHLKGGSLTPAISANISRRPLNPGTSVPTPGGQ